MNVILAALVNGAILGAGITALVWLMLRLAPRRVLNAATRYAIWWAALALAAAMPGLYLPLLRPHRAAPAPVTHMRPPTSAAATQVRQTFAPRKDRPGDLSYKSKSATTDPSAVPASMPPAVTSTAITPPPIASHIAMRWPFPIQVTAEEWPRWILAAWSLISLALLLRLMWSCVLLRRTSARASDAPAPLRALARTWLARCGSKRRGIRLASSTEISIPVAVGPLCPSILIPARLLHELDAGDLDQIGLHETAHLARGDDYALLLQRILESVFALHPVVRWIARQIDLEREIACDDFVVAATGHPRSYASCLTRIVELAGGVGSSVACANAADDRSHLSLRVDMLLDKTRHTGTRLLRTRLTVTVAVLAALGWIAGKTPALVAFAKPIARTTWHAVHQLPQQTMLVQAAPAPQNAAPAAQDLDGRVVEDGSGNPLASAEVRFHHDGMRELAADLDTDAQGGFHVSGLPAGDYSVDIVKPNFVTASLRLRVPASALRVRLVRYGIITGHVTDAEGRPLPSIIRAPGGRSAGGTRVAVLVKVAGSEELESIREASLEDDGRYRVYDLPPGQYAIGVWYDGSKDGSGLQLYPDNAHPRFFPVAGGEEYPGIDFTIMPRATFQVSGKVETATHNSQFALALGLPDQPALPIAQALTDDDGNFRFEKVPAGTYDLFAGGPSAGYGFHDTSLGPEPRFGRTRIQVGQNIERLTIPVSEGRTLTVVLAAHAADKLPAGCPQSVTVSVTALEPWGLFFRNTGHANFGKEQTMRNLAPGRYRLSVAGLAAGCYQVNQPVADLSEESTKPVVIELDAAGSIRGALHAGSPAAKDFAVVLLETGSAADTAAHLAFPDEQGRFVFEGLHPGRYRIAAEPAAEASRTRWVADFARMTEIEVAGGAATAVELPVAAPKGDRQ